jgi:hypothetical protein
MDPTGRLSTRADEGALASIVMSRCYDVAMRTTLDLDDAVLAAARAIAQDRQISLGAAVSELARKGLRGAERRSPSGFPVFDAPDDATPITLDLVNEHRDGD